MSAGWFPDPSGRYGQRWHDGSAWSDHVIGADGNVIRDPLPAAPGTVMAPGRHALPAFPAHIPRSSGSTVRYRPGPGLAAGLAGLVLVALSLFVLKWIDADSGTFLDLSDAVRDAGSEGADQVIYTYAAFGGFACFALAAVWVLLAGLPVPATRGGDTYNRMIGTVICGGAAIYQAVAITRIFDGPASPEIGAWLGVVGYFVIVIGMILGARRVPA